MLKDAIMVCTDGSELAQKGVQTAVELAKAMGVPVLGMTVVTDAPAPANGLAGEHEAVQSILNYIAQQAKAEGVPCELLAEHQEKPFEGIDDVARRYDVRFVVMASRGLGSVGSFLLGSQTQKVVATIDRPVLVIR